jgi:crotonobetainyl-CoA:carnitine CoA-transferase CaiB-like acyl-CoA transferase
MVANGHVADAHYPGFGSFRRHGPTVTFPENPPTVGSAPEVGQHTRAILDELGYTGAEIAHLHAAAIVGWPDGA